MEQDALSRAMRTLGRDHARDAEGTEMTDYLIGFHVVVRASGTDEVDAVAVALAATGWPWDNRLDSPLLHQGTLNSTPVSAEILRAEVLMTRPAPQ